MKVSVKLGECIQCGDVTNVQLDNGKYACMSCLNIIGKQTKNVREYVENMQFELPWYSTQERCNGLIKLLETLKNNEITSIECYGGKNVECHPAEASFSCEASTKIFSGMELFTNSSWKIS